MHTNGINLIGDVIYREVEISTVVKLRSYAVTLLVELRDIEHVARADDCLLRIGKDD